MLTYKKEEYPEVEIHDSKTRRRARPSFKKLLTLLISISIVFGLLAGIAGTFLYSKITTIKRTDAGSSSGAGTTELSVVEDSSTIEVVDAVSPSVVSIVITKDLEKLYDLTGPLFPYDDYLYGYSDPNIPEGKRQIGGGTGFILSQDGMILTNKHVVVDDDAQYTVITSDGQQYPATILGRDPLNDIAVVKIEAEGLPAVSLGDSDALRRGQTVIAIGNSLGKYENTVTKGIISGIGRRVQANGVDGFSETIESAIQTDAAINFGNSGGPLLNLAGQVIGINTAINLEGQLIGFAIPINDAKSIVTSVAEFGKIVRPYLGVRYILVDSYVAKVNSMTLDYGALIIRGGTPEELAVQPGSPADQAGLVENDIILEVNGVGIGQNNDLAREIAQFQPGETVELKIYHKGEEQIVSVTLAEFPQ